MTALLASTACESVRYYGQAISGQLRLLNNREDIRDVLDQADLDSAVRARLEMIIELRSFAANDLGLPVGDAYSSYVDLSYKQGSGKYVVWNVFAAPALSLEAERWCYPVAGCAEYRGYFKESAARKYAAGLRERGLDTQVQGVKAYSTLGWFDDPVLSSFITDDKAWIAGLLLHELAHRQLYVPGDTEFNESFATAVEVHALEQWLQKKNATEDLLDYQKRKQRREKLLEKIDTLRSKLETIYSADIADADKLQGKQAAFREFRTVLTQWSEQEQFTLSPFWRDTELNNASLVPVNSYNRWVPVFQAMLQEAGSLPAFFDRIEYYAKLDKEQREAELLQYPVEALSGEPAAAAESINNE